jgi:hypothetical protein
MKKLLVLSMMLCAVSFANAEDMKEEKVAGAEISKTENVVLEILPIGEVECFALSCGTACTPDGPVTYDSDCDVECFFDILEKEFCN